MKNGFVSKDSQLLHRKRGRVKSVFARRMAVAWQAGARLAHTLYAVPLSCPFWEAPYAESVNRTRNKNAAIDVFDGAWLRLIDGGNNSRDIGLDHRPVNRGHNQHGKWPTLKLLLARYVFVASKKHIKPFDLDPLQQLAVLDAAPLHADDSLTFTVGQIPDKFARHIFVEENLLQWCACG